LYSVYVSYMTLQTNQWENWNHQSELQKYSLQIMKNTNISE